MDPLFPDLIYDPPCPPFNEDQSLSRLKYSSKYSSGFFMNFNIISLHLFPPLIVALGYQVLRIREVIQYRLAIVLVSPQGVNLYTKIPQDLEDHLISLPLTLKRITVSDNQVTTQVKDEEGVRELLPSHLPQTSPFHSFNAWLLLGNNLSCP
ncbi:One of two inversely orientated ORFs in ISC1043 [Saccharolobus solfataricus P2]|uniref:One of two inversely orientated ORFs in ISC1043 n=2 Tax=Saccharolobus solfataricus TaxID=2287 RepID=Q97Y41_SACS2|nr:One of two inversely orientated ORFs in ISC1043 [Saccharolobus solfataricus P2]SAI85161.1 ORF in transpooson ISC1043 [Saccharolobus solfataricus]